MDVDGFIRQYEPGWKRLEALIALPPSEKGADDLVLAYLRTSTQLAEVRSRYSDPELESYLNGLVARAHQRVYGYSPVDRPRARDLFVLRYRVAIRETLPFILAAAGLMIAVTGAVWAWVAGSPSAQAGVLSPGISEAIDRSGGGRSPEMWPPEGVTTFIMLNNVQVCFLAFGLGITFGIGTIWVVIQNSAMLGELAGVFGAAGKSGAFWALILPHGMLELLAICIAAGAGLRIGWAMIVPGELTRGDALREAAKGAVLVVIGVIPAFVLAAFIEGFITGTAIPDWLELAIGTIAFLGYSILVFAPARRAVSHKERRAWLGPVETGHLLDPRVDQLP